MTKHTTGPWVHHPDDNIITTSAGRLILEWFARSNHKLSGETSIEERDANARLVAAAPDLLEALKGLDEAYCRAGSPLTKEERQEDRMRLIKARAAIAKAEGSV